MYQPYRFKHLVCVQIGECLTTNYIHILATTEVYVFELFQVFTVALPHLHFIFLICVRFINKHRDESYLHVQSSRIQQLSGMEKPIHCTTHSLHCSRNSFQVSEWPGIFTTAVYCSVKSWSCFNSPQPSALHVVNSINKLSITNFGVLCMQGQHYKLNISYYCNIEDFTAMPITSVSIYCTTCKNWLLINVNFKSQLL